MLLIFKVCVIKVSVLLFGEMKYWLFLVFSIIDLCLVFMFGLIMFINIEFFG